MFSTSKQSENQAAKPTATNRSFFGGVGSLPFFQAKLTVNQPGDAHEREADAVADQVMRMKTGDSPIVQRMPITPVSAIQRACANCEKEKEGVQRKETGGGDASSKAAPSIVSDVLSSGGGQPMDGGTRQFMESRFGQDFSQVRIHTDSRAAESASAIQARAYTSGRNVVFGSGEYQPSSESGQRLLAHELVHVGQQNMSNLGVQRLYNPLNLIKCFWYNRQLLQYKNECREEFKKTCAEDFTSDNCLQLFGRTGTGNPSEFEFKCMINKNPKLMELMQKSCVKAAVGSYSPYSRRIPIK